MCKYKDEGTRSRPLNVLCNFWLQRPGSCDSTQEALQDVDDWELTELNTDWDVGESGDDVPSLVRFFFNLFVCLTRDISSIQI